jgi:hypothetical protein
MLADAYANKRARDQALRKMHEENLALDLADSERQFVSVVAKVQEAGAVRNWVARATGVTAWPTVNKWWDAATELRSTREGGE